MRNQDHTHLSEEDRIEVQKVSSGSVAIYFTGVATIKTGFVADSSKHFSMSADQARILRDKLEEALSAATPARAVALKHEGLIS